MATNVLNQGFTALDMKDLLAKNPDSTTVLGFLLSNVEHTEITLCNLSEENNVIFLHILSQAVCSPVKIDMVIHLLTLIRDSRFFKFGLAEMIISYDTYAGDVMEFRMVVSDCIELLSQLFMRLPSIKMEIIGLIGILTKKIEEVLPILEENVRKKYFDQYLKILSSFQDSVMKKYLNRDANVNTKKKKCRAEERPPNNFRDIPILPSKEDILNTRGFIRANKVRGGYDDLEHYLDVQFRLYREDCITPLREGIGEYVRELSAGRNIARLQDGRLYKDVVAFKCEQTIDGLLVTMKLNSDYASRIQWKTSQRLLYGSLVCLTADNFQSVQFAIVADSDRDILQTKRTFKVNFERGLRNETCPLNVNLTMIESTAYYEAYRHVLSSLQNIQDGDLPFEKYLVHCKNKVKPPKYFIEESVIYDFHPIVSKDVICKRQHVHRNYREIVPKRTLSVDILSPPGEWPTPEELHLDESQFLAFHAALTEEFVLIQGPPGTGKTYVGLQIVKTLLHNKSVWNERLQTHLDGTEDYDKSPILIVCFTNHALDQFMEGIINFHDKNNNSWKNDIVRVGGRCGSNIVEEFALKKRRRFYRHHVEERTFYRQIIDIQTDIARARWRIKKSMTVILSPSTLSKFILDKHILYFLKRRDKKCGGISKNTTEFDDGAIAKWLGVSESQWVKRASIAYSKAIQKISESNELLFDETGHTLMEPMIEVDTDAKKAEDDRRIEEDDEISEEFQENIGLNVHLLLNEILSRYCAEGNIDDLFKNLLEQEKQSTIRRLESTDKLLPAQVDGINKNLWYIPYENRWCLYRHWVKLYCDQQIKEMENLDADQKKVYFDYQKEKQETDTRILKESTVIAITTTAAARYQKVLREISPRIIIVEEAAEVLEAHIVATLSPKCEHLILIGDHKQLEPKPSVYELEVRYNLGLSLFERMLNNGLNYNCLQRQHRMRPEISTLVRHIYPNLIDNENVHQYEKIEGISKNVFFITHNSPEEKRNDTRSYANVHEANYIMRLCRYLLLQGYEATQITVLAAYNGQMFCIRNLMPKKKFFGVRVCAVDNYQGEENDIILLSLTRSNKGGIIGFLSKENRVCVALSRAKKGLYVIGNFSLLGRKNKLWKKVIKDVNNAECLGDALPLYCRNHQEKKIMARQPNDFDKAPAGGCNEDCDYRLLCGHACRLKCHPKDREHKEYECKKPCLKTCPEGHVCRRKCHHGKDCNCAILVKRTLQCEHLMEMKCFENPNEKDCKVLVVRKMEKCGHEIRMECFNDPSTFDCYEMVSHTLGCGHTAEIECHINPLLYNCKVIVTRERSCGHQYKVKCHENKETYERKVPCKELVLRERLCGHSYNLECSTNEKVYERKHPCKEILTNERPCGHKYKIKCSENHEDYEKLNKCMVVSRKVFPSCGHAINLKCHVDISETLCYEVITKDLKCGHQVKTPCCEQNSTFVCKSKCLKTCINNHICMESCHFGTPCQCKVPVEKTLPYCGHKQTMACDKDPSNEKCKVQVSRIIPKCEHDVKMCCGDDITFVKCTVKVTKVVPSCGHKNTMLCHIDPKKFKKCEKTVSKPLKCGHTIKTKCSKSVDRVICNETVEKELSCGHFQNMKCSDDKTAVSCSKTVMKTMPCGHDKMMICSDTNFKAVRCSQIIIKRYQKCGHEEEMKCYQYETKIRCERNVQIYLPCGHKTLVSCFKNILLVESQNNKSARSQKYPICHKKVSKLLPCKHTIEIECCTLQDEIECPLPCDFVLSCGHICSGRCGDCFKNCLHVPCKMPCEKELICGHDCQSSVCGSCSQCKKFCQFYCPHSECDHACVLPCVPCEQPCAWSCPHYRCTKLCFEECDRPRCNARCPRKLECKHQCLGFCGEPCPTYCSDCHPDLKIENKKVHRECGLLVVLHDCGHEILADELDEMFENLQERSFGYIRCPVCGIVILWHPRYSKTLNRIKIEHNRIKMMLSRMQITEKGDVFFPSVQSHFFDIQKYLTQCKTLLYTQIGFLKDKDLVLNQCSLTLSLVKQLFFILNVASRQRICEQNAHDIYNRTYYLAAQWIMFIAMNNHEEIECISTDQSDEKSVGTLKEEVEGVSETRETKLWDNIDYYNAFEKAKKLLEMPLQFKHEDLLHIMSVLEPCVHDVGQLTIATSYPIFEGLMNIHVEDWDKCLNGHFKLTSSHRHSCVQCDRRREMGNFTKSEIGHQNPPIQPPSEQFNKHANKEPDKSGHRETRSRDKLKTHHSKRKYKFSEKDVNHKTEEKIERHRQKSQIKKPTLHEDQKQQSLGTSDAGARNQSVHTNTHQGGQKVRGTQFPPKDRSKRGNDKNRGQNEKPSRNGKPEAKLPVSEVQEQSKRRSATNANWPKSQAVKDESKPHQTKPLPTEFFKSKHQPTKPETSQDTSDYSKSVPHPRQEKQRSQGKYKGQGQSTQENHRQSHDTRNKFDEPRKSHNQDKASGATRNPTESRKQTLNTSDIHKGPGVDSARPRNVTEQSSGDVDGNEEKRTTVKKGASRKPNNKPGLNARRHRRSQNSYNKKQT